MPINVADVYEGHYIFSKDVTLLLINDTDVPRKVIALADSHTSVNLLSERPFFYIYPLPL